MPITIDKEWAAVDEDEVIIKADTKEVLEQRIRTQELDSNEYEIVALPKSHSSMFV